MKKMSNSELARKFISSPHHSGKRTHKISKIAIHIMGGNLSAENCGYWFADPKAYASSHYGIGSDGDICQYVDESNRPWTTSSSWVDNRAVTIEVANNGGAPSWRVSDKAYQSLLRLVEDICRRNGIKEVTYTGNSNGTLIKHQWYANKACPGAYLGSKFPEIARIITARLKTSVNTSSSTPKRTLGNFMVKVKDPALNIRQKPDGKSKIVGVIRDRGIYTIVETVGEWGKLKSGMGWIWLKGFTERLNQKAKVTTVKKTIKVGSKVRIKGTASRYYTGETIPSRFKGKTYTVLQVGSGRSLIKELYSWVKNSDLEVL